MLEYWILWGCALAAALIGLANNAAWKRDYAALQAVAKHMNQTWYDTASRHNREWAQKCDALQNENIRLRAQLRKEETDADVSVQER